jgi:hypothetical protein
MTGGDEMVLRSRWARTAGAVSIAVLAGAAFAGCGDDSGDGGEEGGDVELDGAAAAEVDPDPDAAVFCQEFVDWETTAYGEVYDDAEEDLDDVEYFAMIRDSFDDLRDIDPPEAIAEDWDAWIDATSDMYGRLADAAAEVDPDDPDSASGLSDIMASGDDEDYAELEMSVNSYLDTNCPIDEPDAGEAEEVAESE